jgi:GGDEF domain-containing protein
LEASAVIQEGLEGMRQRHEATVSQLLEEIRTLHKRIDNLESVASLDLLAALVTRAEMEKRIESLPAGGSRLVLLSLTGLRAAEARFGDRVRAQLAAAFLKRLTRVLPAETAIGRWSEEEFMAILPVPQEPAGRTQNALNEQLSGAYSCLEDGKTVRPELQVRATVLKANQVEISPVPA